LVYLCGKAHSADDSVLFACYAKALDEGLLQNDISEYDFLI